ncbi:MAG: NAD-glutamate dehydrogenase domain-containing protein, partial [Sphingomonadales bacterium]
RAITDILHFEGFDVEHDVSFEIFRDIEDPAYVIRLNIYHPSRLIALSEVLPMLENLGVKVISENSYELLTESGARIHAFYLETPTRGHVNIGKTEDLVEPLLDQVWKHEVENDYFNALAIHAGLPAEEIVVLRAYAKYLRQLGISYSQALIEQTLFQNPKLPRRLMRLFQVLFEPGKKSRAARQDEADKIVRDIKRHLGRIPSLDQDRIFRMYLAAIQATVRTNYYKDDFQPTGLPRAVGEGETPMSALALKIRTSLIPDAPKPRPFMEIFVSSPRIEGVHLRGGPVARGGLRWSDRREDFRTEVLGLMKAQQVKNAVIVPVGAKGGFFPKTLPAKGTREEIQKEGLASYRIFVRTLLSVTDNLTGTKVIPPKKVFRWDQDDPYFVVAADKGTATFSDQANEIARSTGFWLDDAFASGGSNGYDHKKMGITAKGAWVSVARHFREMGVNIETDTTTVIGIGDMSGDVFGNGMLLSKSMKLVAAFDHRNIFFDPSPDPVASFKERKRLFKKSRSSWEDYNPALISEGGGVFKRNVKSIRLTKDLQEFMGVEAQSMTPDEVIHNLLKSGADLLWIGGIGTYVKSSREANSQVGDRANNNIRVNADELKFQVIGEGGNLGMTQRSRIEFARQGGRLNTDFIDNSAGVDCSDKEVNIKILLASAIENGTLKSENRNKLLVRMTDEVSDIVLRDNYFQTQAISMAEAEAAKKHVQHAALIRRLEKEKRLERALENLPTEDQLSKLALKGRGITRPDLSVLVSHTKLWLKDMLLKSDILEAPILKAELLRSFPETLYVKFAKELEGHQLRREIIATNVSNQVVNRAGLTFVTEIEEETGLGVDQIVSAFMVARDVFGLRDCWFSIDALDYKVPADLQIQMQTQIAEFLSIQTGWFLKNLKRPINIENGIRNYQESLGRILKTPDTILGPLEQGTFKADWQNFVINGVPEALAKKVAAFIVIPKVLDLVNVALKLKRPTEEVGKAYFEVGRVLGFDWLRQTTQNLADDDHWEYLAANAIIEDLAEQQRDLTHSILKKGKKLNGLKAVESWVNTHPRTRRRTKRLINDIKTSGTITLAKLSFAGRHIRNILPRKL